MQKEITFSIDRIRDAAKAFWDSVPGYRVFAFHGPMGAGKTTFIHALCDLSGVKDAVTSPTFSLVNEYRTSGGDPIYHIDLYRVRDSEEALQAGMEDVTYSGAICFVEWPEKAPEILPPGTMHVNLAVNADKTRTIKLAGGLEV